MNLWILKYDSQKFSDRYIEDLEKYAVTIRQLSVFDRREVSEGNFHFLSIHSKNIPKQYVDIVENKLLGYSGLVIDKSNECEDLRYIKNINTQKPENYYGQFALFSLNDGFTCVTDVLGFHKIFYGEKNGVCYVSNSFEFLKKMGVFETNIHQMLKDLTTSRFGVFPAYNTLLKGVLTLPEYGKLEISNNGKLNVSQYKSIEHLLTPEGDFESKLKETVTDYKKIAKYLRKYHNVAIGLSGGFDGRLILNIFHETKGNLLQTFTYNRAGNLDLKIASILSKKAGVAHFKFLIKPEINNDKLKISGFKDSDGDPFTMSYIESLKNFYKVSNEYKVFLGGNGGDTDWEFGEKRIANVDKSSMESFIKDYSKELTNHPLLNQFEKSSFSNDLEEYFLKKYHCFSNHPNFQQLLASAFFHLERFRSEQGFGYSQNLNKNHDVFAPFAIESFNQLVFLSNKKQLQRGLREGIQYRLSKELTGGKIPYAPILTSANEHGNNIIQNMINKIAPYLPKIIWKINNGDTNAKIRKIYQSHVNAMYKKFILENKDSEVFNYIDKNEVIAEISKTNYNGRYNQVGSMIKTINDSLS